MSDPRWRDLFSVVADGVGVGAGVRISITVTSSEIMPAAEAVVTEAYSRGAYPQVMLVDERFDWAALWSAPDEVVAWVPELEAHAMEWADVHISLRAMIPPHPRIDAVDDVRLVAQRIAKGRVSTLRWEKTRWCVVRIPTAAWASYMGITESRLLDNFFAGCLVDWQRLRSESQPLVRRLQTASSIRILDLDTDLTLDVRGRRWVLFAGEANMPDGEVATAPIEKGGDGYITFEDPMVFGGREVRGLRLVIEAGRVTDISATVGEAFARQLVSADGGASRVGELGIGLNGAIRTLTRDLFIDEKILGTVHLALGRAYPECGGTNTSAIHWDIVKDLRTGPHRAGGSLFVDAVPLIDRGEFRPGELLELDAEGLAGSD